jgi:hypothetical protein
MKEIIYVFLFCILFSNLSNAKILRVGYTGLALSGVDYTNLTTAHTAAGNGDTIQIYGSVTSRATIIKRLYIVGFGFNLDVHPNLQANSVNEPSVIDLSFQPGSEGSILEGCVVYNPNYLIIASNTNGNIVRIRCGCLGRRC